MDLIERGAAIDALCTCYDTETVTMDNGDEYINYEDAVGEIEQLPPAQPAELETLINALEKEHQRLLEMQKALPEIIHCNDCQHSEYDAMYGDRYCHHNGKAEIVPDDHYCGYGERRANVRSD